jgi:hypothetical protein
VEILWPSGKIEALSNVPADFIYKVVEGEGIKDKAALPALKRASIPSPEARSQKPSARQR